MSVYSNLHKAVQMVFWISVWTKCDPHNASFAPRPFAQTAVYSIFAADCGDSEAPSDAYGAWLLGWVGGNNAGWGAGILCAL